MSWAVVGQEAYSQTALEGPQRGELLAAQPPEPKRQAEKPPARTGRPTEEAEAPSRADTPPPTRRKPPATVAPPERPAPPPRLAFRSPILRLASVPNMLGDFFNQGGQLQTTGQVQLAAEALYFNLGQDLLDWVEEVKTTLQPGEVRQ